MDNVFPAEMHRRGRPSDICFTAEEELYIRILPSLIQNNKPTPAAIRLPTQSLDRGKYNKPEWTLLPTHQNNFVGALRVGDISFDREVSPGGTIYDLNLEHDPLESNYGHCNLEVKKDGKKIDDDNKINRSVRARFRLKLSDIVTLLICPSKQL